MKTLVFFVLLFVRCVFAMLRRFTVGPRRPGWNIPTELIQTLVRGGLIGAKWWGFPWLRELQGRTTLSAPVFDEVDFEAVDAGGVPAEWCRPKNATPDRTLLYLHGGGYVIGSVDSYREVIARLAVGAKAQVLAPNYRLAPEHRFPAANDDCFSVYRWLLETGVSPERIALSGDSAGGALCVDLLCTLRDAELPLAAAALVFSPWLDPLAEGGSMQEQEPFDTIESDFLSRCITTYMGGEDARNPRVSLLRADLSGLPPLRVAVGTCEVLLDQSRELARLASEAGVDATLAEYQDCFHLFQSFASVIPTAEHALNDSFRFLAERLPSPAVTAAPSKGTPS